VYVNGSKLDKRLNLTSRHSYIETPWIPGAKNHHFYDDDRLLLGSALSAGDTVTVQVDAGDVAEATIDLADFERVGALWFDARDTAISGATIRVTGFEAVAVRGVPVRRQRRREADVRHHHRRRHGDGRRHVQLRVPLGIHAVHRCWQHGLVFGVGRLRVAVTHQAMTPLSS
jgi:hypothetical protein